MRLAAFGLALLAASASIAAPALAQGSSQTTILPGYWESTNKLSLLIEDESTKRECITPEKVEQYLAGPSTRHYTCTYSDRRIGGGKVRLGGQCVDRKGRKLEVEIVGDYTPTTFTLKARFNTMLGGVLPIAGVATTDARRIADTCPADEK